MNKQLLARLKLSHSAIKTIIDIFEDKDIDITLLRNDIVISLQNSRHNIEQIIKYLLRTEKMAEHKKRQNILTQWVK